MTQWTIANNKFLPTNRSIYEVVMLADQSGNRIAANNPLSVAISGSTSSYDAFSRLRVSEPYTVADYKHTYGIDPNFLDIVANNATATYFKNQACVRLQTSNVANSRIVHQTKMYHNYLPGKSQLILSTVNMYANVANVTKRTGYYDDSNGLFFEQAGDGTLSFVIRSNTTNTPVDTKFTQDTWNVDKFDGNGPSLTTMNIAATQLFFTDFQWLGVGRVRFGFAHNGLFYVAHESYHSNVLDKVYMSTPNLPVRCEVLNTGNVAGSTGGYLDQICSTVISEGGHADAGQDWSVAIANTRVLGAGNTLPVIAVRLKNSFNGYENRATVRARSIDAFTTGDNIKYTLVKLPNQGQLTGGSWTSVNANSSCEYNETATAYTDGEELDHGYLAAATQGSKEVATTGSATVPSDAKKNFIAQNYDSSNSEIYIVAIKNIGSGTTNVAASIQWREIY